eukprot:TRINITY_DN8526_c0_g2_i5.p1 TRINITY_DN8526_c0_g2~~TRINITY_DN8526_c0_g2_i5.p1  ORF type:complete len:276 (+),score=46.66 TRINITY_DN8526_c0_g2_i5:120-947(+)
MASSPNPPFEKISEKPKRIEIKAREEEFINYFLTFRCATATFNAAYKLHLTIYGSLALKLLIVLSTVLFSIAHLMFQGYLMFKLADSRIISLLCSSVVVILAFLVLNIILLINMLSERNSIRISSCICFGVVTLYMGLLIPGTIWLSRLNATYAAVSAVIIVFSLGVYGIMKCISYVLIPMMLVSSMLEWVVRYLAGCLKGESSGSLEYNTYCYRNDKSTTKECVICLVEYKDEEAVCVLNCDRPHIFHEQCITEWLNMNPVCPVCRSKVTFMCF